MTDGLLLVAAVLVGLLLGLLLARAADRGRRPVPAAPPGPAGSDAAAVLGVLRSASVLTAPDGRVVMANPPARSSGLVRADRLTHPPLQDLLAQVAADGSTRDAELEVPRGPLGRGTLSLHVRVAPLGTGHLLLLAEDRTEARRVEAVRRDFVVNVSHELKTPVGALSLLAETLDHAADDPDAVRRFAGRIQTEAARLSALVHEVIALSRLQDADPLRAASPVRVAAVVAEAVDRARTSADARGIALDVGPQPDAVVVGDHDLLVTAVRNLLDNAVTYSGPRTRVGVGTAVRDDVVEVAVVDQGVGIPADALPRVFERFYRVDPARSRDTGGTGLGLSIVKHVVADHGGEVTVWSQPGQGSTFTVRLPLAHLADEPSPPGTSPASTEGA